MRRSSQSRPGIGICALVAAALAAGAAAFAGPAPAPVPEHDEAALAAAVAEASPGGATFARSAPGCLPARGEAVVAEATPGGAAAAPPLPGVVLQASEAAASPGGAASAPGCLPVHGEAIVAGDLAAVNPAFAALDPKTRISTAPLAGARRVFRGPELARLARQHGLAAGPLRDACFAWPAGTITPQRLARVMAGVLGCEPGAIEIVEQSRFPAPAGDLVFEKKDLAEVPGAGGRLLFWKGFVRYSAGWRFPVWARLRIVAPARRLIARTPLPLGEPIPAEAIETIVVADAGAAGGWVTSETEVVGRVPRMRIEPGAAIRLTDLASPPEIQAGDLVQVEVRNGAMRIRSEARAERSGRAGDMIPLINPASSSHFRGRVEGKDRVVVTVRGK